MNQKINMKQIERKAYTSYHEDGILEITVAVVVFTFAIMMMIDMPWLGGIAGALAVSFYAGIKKLVTIPRIGYVRLPVQRAQKITAIALVLGIVAMVAGMFAFVQTTSSGVPDWLLFLIDYYMITIGVAVAVLFLLGAYAFKTTRMYAYALLTATMFVGGYFLTYPLYYYLAALGTIILAAGLFMLARFINKYPKPTQTMDAQ
ncbi:MAG: hypothetical protein NWF03_04610 [Candidatus Bathyarchaeota archaeon]|nr:hypothetical protein [Candidatus Bathyarchaeota archaeon]